VRWLRGGIPSPSTTTIPLSLRPAFVYQRQAPRLAGAKPPLESFASLQPVGLAELLEDARQTSSQARSSPMLEAPPAGAGTGVLPGHIAPAGCGCAAPKGSPSSTARSLAQDRLDTRPVAKTAPVAATFLGKETSSLSPALHTIHFQFTDLSFGSFLSDEAHEPASGRLSANVGGSIYDSALKKIASPAMRKRR
jgi:hypothetical protein